MSSAESPAELDAAEVAELERRARRGLWIVAAGVAGILWGVFHLLGEVGGPEARDFAHRQTYDQVKPVLQREFFGAALRSVAGLFLAMGGGHMRANALRALGRSD